MYKINIFPPTGSLPSHTVTPPDMAAKMSAFFDKKTKALTTKSHNRPTDIDTWYCCLGHINYDTIQRMFKNNIIQGMNITNLVAHLGACEDCIMGMHMHWPFYMNDNCETEIE